LLWYFIIMVFYAVLFTTVSGLLINSGIGDKTLSTTEILLKIKYVYLISILFGVLMTHTEYKHPNV
jgi:hypothetical protein